MPHTAWFDSSSITYEASAIAMSAMPFSVRSSERVVYDAGTSGCNAFSLPVVRFLHELSLTGTRFKSPLWGETDALALNRGKCND